MGQYFYIVNKTKRQYLHPHNFGGGMKLYEIAYSELGAMFALTFLTASNRNHVPFSRVGTWCGDSIAIVGDYSSSDLFEEVRETYENISFAIIEELCRSEPEFLHEYRARVQADATLRDGMPASLAAFMMSGL